MSANKNIASMASEALSPSEREFGREARIVVLGGGESGFGAAYLAKKRGLEVFLSDKGTIRDNYKQLLEENNIEFEENQHSEDRILSADWIIKSPGIPKKAEIIHKIHEKGFVYRQKLNLLRSLLKLKLWPLPEVTVKPPQRLSFIIF